MIKIENMMPREIHALLEQVGYGHLGCVRGNRPYVVPIQFVYSKPNIYIFTVEGLKTELIKANPEVCLQAEVINDPRNWRSVVINGRAELLTSDENRAFAQMFIKDANPALTSALHEKWAGPWARESVSAIYRIHPDFISGRKTVR